MNAFFFNIMPLSCSDEIMAQQAREQSENIETSLLKLVCKRKKSDPSGLGIILKFSVHGKALYETVLSVLHAFSPVIWLLF